VVKLTSVHQCLCFCIWKAHTFKLPLHRVGERNVFQKNVTCDYGSYLV